MKENTKIALLITTTYLKDLALLVTGRHLKEV